MPTYTTSGGSETSIHSLMCQTDAIAIEVQINQVTKNVVSGLAWAPCSPSLLVKVEAILRNEIIGRATANIPRPDLGSNGANPGPRGFNITLERALDDTDIIAVRASAPVASEQDSATEQERTADEEPSTMHGGTISALIDDHKSFTVPGPEFEHLDSEILKDVKKHGLTRPPILLAFYLTQFHAIPENDKYWGKGFTEWQQLSKGMPRFPAHYQPRIPRDLGHYNLTNIESMRAQVEIARAAGIGGFAFYYYRFGDRRLLEKPLEQFLTSDLDMPFVLIWANESWTNAWADSPQSILLNQTYDAESEDLMLDDFFRHFSDRRYIRLSGGRPLLIVYDPRSVPEPRASVARWRWRLADKCGVEPLIFMAQTFGETDPRVYGCDGALEFPPHKLMDRVSCRPAFDAYSKAYSGRIINYDDFVAASLHESDAGYPLIKTVVPSWDNEARYPNRGITLESISPGKYEAWLRTLITRAMESPTFDTAIVAINAWNEWAEGAYLEPDVYFGSAFLNATARAYRSAVSANPEVQGE